MKIDLHCHTKKTKSGDGEGRNVSADLFKEKVVNAGIKIIAITNHNAFDLTQFNELQEAVKDDCQLWPGVEIDINGSDNKKYHLIVVANPDNTSIFNARVQELFEGDNIEVCAKNIETVFEKLNDCDVIYIPHYKKTPGISEEDLCKLISLVGEATRVFDETQNNRSLGVFANHDYNVIIGSDVKDWNKYEECNFSELKLPVSSFSQFCLLAKRDEAVVETLLNQKKSYNVKAKPHSSVTIDLKIYDDVNIIFGQKGTGKSKILESIHQSLVSQGIECSVYAGAQKDDEFNSLLKTTDMERNISIVGSTDCKEEFEYIFDWKDTNPTLFSNYISWFKTRNHNSNKKRMKITEAATLIAPSPESYAQHADDYKTIKHIKESLDRIVLDNYISEEERINLLNGFDVLYSKIKSKFILDILEANSTKLTNYSINAIKGIADKNSNSVSKPSSTGFIEYAQNRIMLIKALKKILENITDKNSFKLEYLGELEDKGEIYIRRLFRMLSNESKTAEFVSGIRVLNDIKSKMLQATSMISSDSLSAHIDSLKGMCIDHSINSTAYFLGISKQIVTADNTEYVPSNGEKGILLLQKRLKKSADAYFLDEPELGMGNSYVDSIIRPQISELAKRHKAVIIATHNANIAVRTLPYMSIFRTYQNGVYGTYIGNPFNDQLVNIKDENDKLSWTAESLHTLEGGKEAFNDRRIIYGSNDNCC